MNRTFTADLSASKRVFATGVQFLMGNGVPVPYDPKSFYHGVLIGRFCNCYVTRREDVLSHDFT